MPNGSDRLIRIYIAEFVSCCDQLINAVEDVIAEHNRYLQIGSKPPHFARAGNWIYATSVGDDSNVFIPNALLNSSNERRKIYGVPEVRIGLALFLQDRHSDLGEIVECEAVKRTIVN